jgi:hypothetical protein
MIANHLQRHYYSLGDTEGRRLYQECIPLELGLEQNPYKEDPEKDVAYMDGLIYGYNDEKEHDCTTNFIYPEDPFSEEDILP